MEYYIELNGTFTNISTWIKEDVMLEERLDKVLDSGSFFMNSESIDKNIPPFTRFKIVDGLTTKYYYCSSVCFDTLNPVDRYYHQVQLVEPTKILEAFIVGTKSFSVINGKSNYNSNYDRIRILCELINQKYGVSIELDPTLSTLSEEREYSFGTGFTLYDCLEEIMNTENAIPRVKGWNDNSIVLTCDKIDDVETETITPFSKWNYKENNQGVDDYCSSLESELSEVVDRDTIQVCYLTVRSQDTLMSKSNSCLITPSKIEDVKSLELVGDFKAKATKLFLLRKSDLSSFINNVNTSGITQILNTSQVVVGNSYLISPLGYGDGSFFMDLFNNSNAYQYGLFKAYLESFGINDTRINASVQPGVSYHTYVQLFDLANSPYRVDYPNILDVLDLYYVCTIYDDYGYYQEYSSNLKYTNVQLDLTDYVLNEEQWNLLDANTQPDYLYFKSGQNYIEGFYNTKDSELWNKLVYGEKGPFLKDYLDNNLSSYYQTSIFSSADKLYLYYLDKLYVPDMHYVNGIMTSSEIIPLFADSGSNNGILSYTDALNKAFESNDFTKYIYRVKYTTISPMFLKANKSIGPTNETIFKATSRSFNNGPTTIDYNQLVPAIQRATDMLGLEQRSIISQENLAIGTRTQFGYIISKKSTIYPLYNEYTYYCCDNFQQIAAAISVRTQYEATNLPQIGVVDRFIYDELTVSSQGYNALKKEDTTIYLGLQTASTSLPALLTLVVVKPCQKLENNGNLTLVCEAVDNYEFDSQSVLGFNNYYKKTPIKYCDSDNFIEQYNGAYLCTLNGDNNVELFNTLPSLYKPQITILQNVLVNKKIYKDSRERLIFVIRVKEE